MKNFIQTSKTSKTGFELLTIDDNNIETIIPINDQPKNEPKTLILPENSSNRKYFNTDKIIKNNGKIELTYKETINIDRENPKSSKTIKKLEDYLNPEDRETFDKLIKKAQENKKLEETKTPQKKLEEKIAKMMTELEEMKNSKKSK